MNIIGETGVKSWLQIKISGISKFGLFFSKSIVQIAVFMILVLPILFLAFGVFKFPTGLNILARFLPFTWMAKAFRLTMVKELGFGSLSLTFLDSFRITKSDLEGRPVYVSSPDHINVHFLVCFIALTMIRLIQYRVLKHLGKSTLNEDGWESGISADIKLPTLSELRELKYTFDKTVLYNCDFIPCCIFKISCIFNGCRRSLL